MIGLPWIQVELQVSMSFLARVAVARLTSRCSGTSVCTTCYIKKLLRPMAQCWKLLLSKLRLMRVGQMRLLQICLHELRKQTRASRCRWHSRRRQGL